MDARAINRVHVADEVSDTDAPTPRVQLRNNDEVALDIDCGQHGRARRRADAVEVLPEQMQEAEALQRARGVAQLLCQDLGRWRGGGGGCGESAEEEVSHFGFLWWGVGGGGLGAGVVVVQIPDPAGDRFTLRASADDLMQSSAF